MSEGIVVIGLGEVSETHTQAIERFTGALVLAGVDIDPEKTLTFRGQELAVYENAAEAIREQKPDTVVVATSTPTHFEACQEVFRATDTPLRVLVEKPGADSLAKTRSLLYETPDNIELEIMHHFAYSPEVLWVAEHLPEWERSFGKVIRYDATYEDPRSGDTNAGKRLALSSSWLDWGINALSSAQTMIGIAAADSYELDVANEMTAHMKFQLGSIAGTIATLWEVERPVFDVQIGFESGAQLSIDQFNVTATLTSDGQAIAHFPNPGMPRRLSHHINMYKDYFAHGHMKFDTATTLQLYELLFNAS